MATGQEKHFKARRMNAEGSRMREIFTSGLTRGRWPVRLARRAGVYSTWATIPTRWISLFTTAIACVAEIGMVRERWKGSDRNTALLPAQVRRLQQAELS
jgi:hypothetical protein